VSAPHADLTALHHVVAGLLPQLRDRVAVAAAQAEAEKAAGGLQKVSQVGLA
jgi:hypothetical protein